MVLKLYTHKMFICGRRVPTILVEKRIPFQFMLAENINSEAWLGDQPVSRYA
jgi:hypothetical protein